MQKKTPFSAQQISAVTSIAWPALPPPQGAIILALQYQLEKSQWWPTAQIAEKQMTQLAALLDHAHAKIPYYRERLSAGGYRPGMALTAERFAQIALLTRQEVQDLGSAQLSTQPPREHGGVQTVRTSGSTGRPVEILDTELNRLFWLAFTLRDHLWHERDFHARFAAIRFAPEIKDSKGVVVPGWGPATDALFETAPSYVLHIGTPVNEQAQWLLDCKPEILLTHPSNALALAEYCLEHEIQLPSLREIRTLSEALPERLRELCQRAWGAVVKDMYSTREAGYLALQCPSSDQYHIQSENAVVEIIDDAGRPCGPGEVGRVIVTPLHNFASPLIRYEIGDYAEVGTPCTCGRTLPTIQRILGRVRNMLTLPNGERRWPVLDYNAYRMAAPIQQMQLVQKSPTQLEAKVVASRPLTASEEAALQKAVSTSLAFPGEICIVCVREIPRSAAGKYEEFLNETGDRGYVT